MATSRMARRVGLSAQRSLLMVAAAAVLLRWYRSLHDSVHVAFHASKAHPWVLSWVRSSAVLRGGYRAPWWLSVGSQFLVGTVHSIVHNALRRVLCPVTQVPLERELLRLRCGGTVGLDWAWGCAQHGSAEPVVLLHHGLAGCSRSHYVQMAASLLARRFRVVIMVARGCGGVPLTTPAGFTAAGFEDMEQVAQHLRARNPDAKIYGVGYSLGAGIMASYVGRAGKDCIFSGAAVCSPCWDYMARTSWFEPWSRKFLATSLKNYAVANRAEMERHPGIDFDKILSAITVAEYDTHAVLPVYGYETIDHYYKHSSPIQHAHCVSIPMLSLSADDDPLCSVEGAQEIERQRLQGSGLLIMRTKRGGHLSWAEGWSGYDSFMDRCVLDWISHCHDNCVSNTLSQPASP
jgi:predicted alpha/beta-fold hydrolase